MEIGMVGLGKMGANMTTRLLKGGHSVAAFDRNAPNVKAAVEQGAQGIETLAEMVSVLTAPRTAWVMVPAGDPTEGVINELAASFSEGDTIIDGGNSNYKDTMRRAEALSARGVHLVDVGTSGGIWGLAEGYSMMVGGGKEAVERLTPILETLAPGPEQGWGHVGPSGSGHFVKMIHNGIEYGLMQAYAEGFEILRKKEQFDLDVHQVAEIWRFGSVVRSWLLDLTAAALEEDASLSELEGWVADSGEGRWTVAEAIDLDVPAPVITLSLLMRLVSRQDERYAAKLLAAMRAQFGGHAVKRAKEQ
ncbi:MAG: decarboxylating 6-phosphogluconate dehydrogenase [Chloroflexi bacterium]|nr:decarboxylating 6-phosphogluconate dehydrogenase [Chloroflexota bacterium]MCI0807226.1 decarboxylating 6-phosphogluconate dehydrogenase [Chloroflexota bacterium]MCI0861880.1 decarboxylating 6-phosphogluconate dehydrogenase [Chloroflexota bacterium]MCI0877086.1 decarboxylating 6-phosphogluconate dehydrogenase [Chloroflexota bacterium]MCI0892920.1 decarboxylating 6-phosphogluconate dehydrogenase [Chloroflexota bacterium]